MTLALYGGKAAVQAPLKHYNSISDTEVAAVVAAMRSGTLSGFLGGQYHGGMRVAALEQQVCDIFGCKHAVAVNSATSGLLVACMAVGVRQSANGSFNRASRVAVSPLTMSATAAAPAFLSSRLIFTDVEDKNYGVASVPAMATAMIVTNLFGHPARLHELRKACDALKIPLIEDNAQSIFARENNKYTGTIGHIGVFSFNVHKHLQSGEGGICVTDDEELASKMRLFRNHAEMAGSTQVGLNLRMTEIEAAIILSQLNRHEELIAGRIDQAESFTHMAANIPGIVLPTVREGCNHVYYMWAIRVTPQCPVARHDFVKIMRAEGVPLTEGYVAPLYRLNAFGGAHPRCLTAERLHDKELVCFENCLYSPSQRQMKQIRVAFDKVTEYVNKLEPAAV